MSDDFSTRRENVNHTALLVRRIDIVAPNSIPDKLHISFLSINAKVLRKESENDQNPNLAATDVANQIPNASRSIANKRHATLKRLPSSKRPRFNIVRMGR